MPTYVYRDGKLVEKHLASAKTSGNRVHIISDEMEPTKHMANGKYYTSKKRYRDATRAAGCIEVGSEIDTMLKPRKPIPLDRGARREAIRQAIYQLKNGR